MRVIADLQIFESNKARASGDRPSANTRYYH